MKVHNVGMTNYRKQQNFAALHTNRAPLLFELVAEVAAVLKSGNKEEAEKLLNAYRAVQPDAPHGENIKYIARYYIGGAPEELKAKALFGIP